MKGYGEPVRLALFIGGVDFEDVRVSPAQVAELRASGRIPFGQVPVLEIGGQTWAQSQALLRWAGRRAGLYPEALQLPCDAVEEALVDVRGLLRPLWYGHVLRAPGVKCVPLTEEQKAEAAKAINESILPQRFADLEGALARSGGPYFCGERMTTCDLSFFVLGGGILDGSYAEGVSPAVLDGCPGLLGLLEAVAAHPKVREWSRVAARS